MSGPSISTVRKLDPTVSVSRGSASRGPHSAINAIARVCSCLQLLCKQTKRPRYPRYSHDVSPRAVSRVVSQIVTLPSHAQFRVLTPIIHNGGNARGGLVSDLTSRNFIQIQIGKRVHRLASGVRLSGGRDRRVRIIISHLIGGSNLRRHLTSSLTAYLGQSRKVIIVSVLTSGGRRTNAKRTITGSGIISLSSHLPSQAPRTTRTKNDCNRTLTSALPGRLIFSRGFTYPRRKTIVRRLSPQLFSFGSPCNTYPRYRKLNDLQAFSTSLIIPSPALPICTTVTP